MYLPQWPMNISCWHIHYLYWHQHSQLNEWIFLYCHNCNGSFLASWSEKMVPMQKMLLIRHLKFWQLQMKQYIFPIYFFSQIGATLPVTRVVSNKLYRTPKNDLAMIHNELALMYVHRNLTNLDCCWFWKDEWNCV